MRRHRSVVVLALILTLFSSTRSLLPLKNGARASCVFKQSCVLPCSIRHVAGILRSSSLQLYWNKIHPESTPVYAFSFQIKLPLSGPAANPYDERAQVFLGQLHMGNLSLLLEPIQIQDQGVYSCLLKHGQKVIKRSLVHVDVQAPVSEVLLEEDGQRLKCVSRDIFPRPSVSWSPPSDHSPSVTSSETGLFSVNSSVPLTQRLPLEYSCNVSTAHSWRSATYRKHPPVHTSDSEVTLLCANSSSSVTEPSPVWKFNRNETIVTQTTGGAVCSEAWRPFVAGVSESGNLTLKGLGREHGGLYTCEFTSDRETFSIHTRLEDRVLVRNIWSYSPHNPSGLGPGAVASVAVAVGVTVAAAGLAVGLCICKRKKVLKTQSSATDPESDKCPNGAPTEHSGLLGGEAQVGDGNSEAETLRGSSGC